MCALFHSCRQFWSRSRLHEHWLDDVDMACTLRRCTWRLFGKVETAVGATSHVVECVFMHLCLFTSSFDSRLRSSMASVFNNCCVHVCRQRCSFIGTRTPWWNPQLLRVHLVRDRCKDTQVLLGQLPSLDRPCMYILMNSSQLYTSKRYLATPVVLSAHPGTWGVANPWAACGGLDSRPRRKIVTDFSLNVRRFLVFVGLSVKPCRSFLECRGFCSVGI